MGPLNAPRHELQTGFNSLTPSAASLQRIRQQTLRSACVQRGLTEVFCLCACALLSCSVLSSPGRHTVLSQGLCITLIFDDGCLLSVCACVFQRPIPVFAWLLIFCVLLFWWVLHGFLLLPHHCYGFLFFFLLSVFFCRSLTSNLPNVNLPNVNLQIPKVPNLPVPVAGLSVNLPQMPSFSTPSWMAAIYDSECVFN